MGNGAKLESPHIGTRSLRIPAEVRLSNHGPNEPSASPGAMAVALRRTVPAAVGQKGEEVTSYLAAICLL